jgi:hypothetical protein
VGEIDFKITPVLIILYFVDLMIIVPKRRLVGFAEFDIGSHQSPLNHFTIDE